MRTILSPLPDTKEAKARRQTRDGLILKHMPYVETLARRMAKSMPNSVGFDDLIQDGVLGLIDAANNFDPERGVKFESFAERRIRGAMIDALRKDAWPRGTRRQRRELEEVRETFRIECGEEPSIADLAERIGTDETRLKRVIVRISMIELTAPTATGEHVEASSLPAVMAPTAHKSPHDSYEESETRIRIEAAIKSLPFRERKVVRLYYSAELTMAEIGPIIGVNESRVSQLHARAIRHLRKTLATQQPQGDGMSRMLQAPPMWRPRLVQPNKPTKVLVIYSGDLFGLATRMDPNVIFWGPDAVSEQSIIPPYITDIWISTRAPLRQHFVVQAIKRDLKIWNDEADELERKLLPIWGFPGNLEPLNSAGESLEDPESAGFEQSGNRLRLKLLKQAAAKLATQPTRPNSRKPAAKPAATAPKPTADKVNVSKVSAEALSSLPQSDRSIYVRYAALAGNNGNQVAIVASEVGLPVANVERIIKRVESKLASKVD